VTESVVKEVRGQFHWGRSEM